MSKVGDRVPGWYPDPDDGTKMRRWDGDHWTADRRALPSWYRPGRGAGGSMWHRNRHWLVLCVVVGCLILALAFRSMTAKVKLPPRTVTDAAFVDAANRTCKPRLEPLRAARPQLGTPEAKDPGSEDKVAGQVDHIVSELRALEGEVRALQVAADQRAAVDGWLGDWHQYVAFGQQYADALRAHDVKTYNSVAAASTENGQRANLFAKANGLADCQF